VDLEPVVRDAVVLFLPFQPEIAGETEDIELAEGITLVFADEQPEAPVDERWAALAPLREGADREHKHADVPREEER
jgi:uncharacterized protein